MNEIERLKKMNDKQRFAIKNLEFELAAARQTIKTLRTILCKSATERINKLMHEQYDPVCEAEKILRGE